MTHFKISLYLTRWFDFIAKQSNYRSLTHYTLILTLNEHRYYTFYLYHILKIQCSNSKSIAEKYFGHALGALAASVLLNTHSKIANMQSEYTRYKLLNAAMVLYELRK